MLKGNKGEWSEIYALFKLLGDGQLNLGDSEFNKLEGFVYPIIKILRSESNGSFEYTLQDELVIINGNNETVKISIDEFKTNAKILLDKIKKSTNRTFSLPEIEEFMFYINCYSLKASSTTKTDIKIVIHDQKTNQSPLLGFSIKSQLGSPSTLLNAGKTTNFIYEIKNLNLSTLEIDRINEISTKSKIMDRISNIHDRGGQLKFHSTEKSIFSNNLILIDSKLPSLLSHIIMEFYTSNKSRVSELINKVSAKNPLNYDETNDHKFYDYKVKRFMSDIAVGMMPSKVWTGTYDANGGILIVKENGDVVCYHIYNRNEFENYLFNNTKLETASSSRHGFGQIYKSGNKLFFKLNLQIRFIK